MVQPATPLPAQSGPAIDRDHLRQMTLGDAALEREVLQLFDRQAALLIERMRSADAKALSALAHALKGSARGIGAWQVAEAVGVVERGDEAAGGYDAALNALAAAVAVARAAIARILAAG